MTSGRDDTAFSNIVALEPMASSLRTAGPVRLTVALTWYRAHGEMQGHLFLTRVAHEDPDFSYLSAALGYKRMF